MGCIVCVWGGDWGGVGGAVLSQALSLSVLGQRADRQAGITAAGQEKLSQSLFWPSCSQIWPLVSSLHRL